jgi:hypothetical protein
MKAKFAPLPAPAFIFLLALWFALFCGFQALAEPAKAPSTNCAPIDVATQKLKAAWGEELIGRGLMPSGSVLAFFTDPVGDSWTALVVFPDGMTCVAAAGTGWEILPPPAPGQEG